MHCHAAHLSTLKASTHNSICSVVREAYSGACTPIHHWHAPQRSDILTPLPAMGVAFDIDDHKGPIIEDPILSMEGTKKLHSLELDKLGFVGE